MLARRDAGARIAQRCRAAASRGALLVTVLGLLGLGGAARAQVVAHFTVASINGGCFVDDQEPVFEGDPERHFRMAIFDDDPAALAGCGPGCVADSVPATIDGQSLDYCTISTGCGTWNFTDQSIAKVIPDQSAAAFYFGLFDQDSDANDSLGDHWLVTSSPTSGTTPNNNASPYDPLSATPVVAVCGALLEGVGDPANYQLTYSVWFTDSSAPPPAVGIQAKDDGLLGVGWDNDTTLSFEWTVGEDPNSGLAEQTVDVGEGSPGNLVLVDQPVALTGTLDLCPTCTTPLTVQHGQIYFLQIASRNGLLPVIQNPQWSQSAIVAVGVDLVTPTSIVVDPPAGTWLNASGALVDIADSDSGAGLDTCEIVVQSAGTTTISGATRACDGTWSLTVGPAAACRDEGANACAVRVRSTDLARNTAGYVTEFFSVDFTPDPVVQLQAFTEPGGLEIFDGVPQPDATPTLEWAQSGSAAPIVGYSWALDTDPDCVPDQAATSVDLGPLAPGSTVFRVRAIDAADNCGSPSSFTVVVDVPSAVPGLGLAARVLLGVGLAALALRAVRKR